MSWEGAKALTRNSADIRRRYDYTYNLSRRGWAWEFLRRNPTFLKEATERAAAVRYTPCKRNIIIVVPGAGQSKASKWGLYYFPDPNLDGLAADAFWQTDLYQRSVPLVLTKAEPGFIDDIYERTTTTCKALYVVLCSDGQELMIVVGQARTIQAKCSGISFTKFQRLRMSIGIDGMVDFKQKMRIIDRASAVYDHTDRDQFPEWKPRDKRLRDALIAIDCSDAGMSLQETARIIFGEQHVKTDWSSGSNALKENVRRLRRKGTELRNGEYRSLLAAPV